MAENYIVGYKMLATAMNAGEVERRSKREIALCWQYANAIECTMKAILHSKGIIMTNFF
jgi:hypothetical protein